MCQRAAARRRRMIVSLSPVPIALSISSVFWTALLSLLIALFVSFFSKFTMVRAFATLSIPNNHTRLFLPSPAVSELQEGCGRQRVC